MNAVPVTITRIARRMRGGSQAWQVLAEDGQWYVAKFCGNPQGNRTLVNEWVAHQLLRQLGVSTPNLRILQLPQELRSENLHFLVGSRRLPPRGTLHLGSQYPVNPETTCIFDFVPSHVLRDLVNLTEFAAILVFDKWVVNTDSRQAIFVRERSVARGFRAHFIDNGMIFAGDEWQLRDEPRLGTYFRSEVYTHIDLESLVETFVGHVETFTEDSLLATMDGLPSGWLAPGDRYSFLTLLRKLRHRQARLRSILTQHLKALNLPDQTVHTHVAMPSATNR